MRLDQSFLLGPLGEECWCPADVVGRESAGVPRGPSEVVSEGQLVIQGHSQGPRRPSCGPPRILSIDGEVGDGRHLLCPGRQGSSVLKRWSFRWCQYTTCISGWTRWSLGCIDTL